MGLFSQHEEACTPLTPCRICKAVTFLNERLKPNGFIEFLELIGELPPTPPKQVQAPQALAPLTAELLSTPIDQLGCSTRVRCCLQNDNILTVKDLLCKNELQLSRIPNFGRRSLNEVKDVLAGRGLRLGMRIDPELLGQTSA